jgi:hypothetical protein
VSWRADDLLVRKNKLILCLARLLHTSFLLESESIRNDDDDDAQTQFCVIYASEKSVLHALESFLCEGLQLIAIYRFIAIVTRVKWKWNGTRALLRNGIRLKI